MEQITVDEMKDRLGAFVDGSAENRISQEQAIEQRLVGMKLYERPLLGVARADDERFLILKQPEAIGAHFLLPKEWMPEGKTVISIFFPYTEEIKRANAQPGDEPAPEWLHGRFEGQQFLDKACAWLKEQLEALGGTVVVPTWDPRFQKIGFSSNWSERHVAFLSGLGTFGLSKGLITKAGMAGRLSSLITDLEFPPTPCPYQDLYEYCSRCGACIRRCPAGAISFEKGKDHQLCMEFLGSVGKKHAPRYGCGKCQTGVPYESKIPTF